MDHQVSGIRQLKRGLEAEVTVGLGTVPSASVTMKVVLGPTDPEWKAIQHMLHELLVRRATSHIRAVVEYDLEREKRTAAALRKQERAAAKEAS